MYGYGTIKDYENYVIRSDGVVINIITKREMKPCTDKDGYLLLNLTNEGKSKTLKLHRLLGKAFIDGEDETHNEIDHIDQNKTNNSLSNLRWATRSEQCFNKKHKPSNTGEPYISLTKSNTYAVEIRRNGKRIRKRFKTMEEAVIARDKVLPQ
tara:strand:+ start:92 stop:550 length:459 start_codon:yes stop_codon:yes gene_type:complete